MKRFGLLILSLLCCGIALAQTPNFQVTASTLSLTSVAAASGGTTVYTGTITGGASNALQFQQVTVSGFTNAANNGTFLVSASTATALTLQNASGVAETHAGSALLGYYPTAANLMGMYGPNFYSSQYCNNLLCMFNDSFQPVQYAFPETADGGTSGTNFLNVNHYDPIPANFAVGWPFQVVGHGSATTTTGGASGSTGTITANSAGCVLPSCSSVVGSFTLSSTTASLSPGDLMFIRSPAGRTNTDCSQIGFGSSGTGTCTMDTTPADLPPSVVTGLPGPVQVPQITNTSGQTYTLFQYLDSASVIQNFLQGIYCATFDAYLKSGSITAAPSLDRPGQAGYFTATANLAGSGWQHYSICSSSINETAATNATCYNPTTPSCTLTFRLQFSGTGSFLLNNLKLPRQTHTTIGNMDDRVIAALQLGKWGGLRHNIVGYAGGCTTRQLLLPEGYRPPCQASQRGQNDPYGYGIGVGMGLDDFTKDTYAMGGTEIIWELGPTATTQDVIDAVDYFGGAAGTVGANARISLGTTAAWTTKFRKISIVYDNEEWNNTQPGYYFYPGAGGINYLPLAVQLGAAAHADTNWNPAIMEFSANTQQAIGAGNATQVAAADPTGANIQTQAVSAYTGGTADNCTQPYLTQVAYTEAYAHAHDPNDLLYQIGASSKKTLNYEASLGEGGGNCTQPQLLGFPEGQGFGVSDVLTPAYLQRAFPQHFMHYARWEYNGFNRAFYPTLPTYWSNTVTYAINAQVNYQGYSFYSTANGNIGNPPTSGGPWTFGTPAYSSTVSYNLGDIVTSSGVTYISQVASNLNNTPATSTSQWGIAASTIAGWGDFNGTGGVLFNPRPTVYAQASYNSVASLGTGRSVVATNIPTYNFAGGNGIPAESNVPYIDAFAFCGGDGTICTSTARGMMVANLDTTSSHQFTISGLDQPTGTVQITTYTSANVTDNNESSVTVTSTTISQSGFTLMTLAPHSTVVLSWTAGSSVPGVLF